MAGHEDNGVRSDNAKSPSGKGQENGFKRTDVQSAQHAD